MVASSNIGLGMFSKLSTVPFFLVADAADARKRIAVFPVLPFPLRVFRLIQSSTETTKWWASPTFPCFLAVRQCCAFALDTVICTWMSTIRNKATRSS